MSKDIHNWDDHIEHYPGPTPWKMIALCILVAVSITIVIAELTGITSYLISLV